MNYLYLLAGIFLFVGTIADIVKTTLSSQGGGGITNVVSKAVWKLFFAAAGHRGKSKLLGYAGLAVLLCILLLWILGMWGGLFLMLLADPDAVVNSSTHASVLEKLYYAGYTLSTLGNGGYMPGSNSWRLVTDIGSFSGLVFITTSITYFVPVLSAVNLQSQLSLLINSMGETPQKIVSNSWDGNGFSAFTDNVPSLCQLLLKHTIDHHSYPVIHYFHNSKQRLSVVLSLAKLDEVQLLLAHAVPAGNGNDQLKLAMLRAALEDYLGVVLQNYVHTPDSKGKLPVPDVGQLAEYKLPLKPLPEINSLFEQQLRRHREQVNALLQNDGWDWQDIYQGQTVPA
ncbi:ion channel [Pontibacter chitinilyticus]|uniref:ion channel n=1 Tax=Pontibacter chitinilyticus TaxID=2674989 RepID=UPI00321A565E